ncbi:MAG: hypothetical protein DMF99_29795 [Acidobacteria bacterium]|nr:MAG: hypothetical protein DMF99_29795 [Acidobacteriota bacterium]
MVSQCGRRILTNTSGLTPMDAQNCALRFGKKKSRGMTPTTVIDRPLRTTSRPTMPGSPPNTLCHAPYDRTSTRSLPSKVSLHVKVRPSSGRTPSTSKRLPVVAMPFTGCGSPLTLRNRCI